MLKYYQGKTIWITGASSGIGRAMTLQLATMQTTLILSSRNREELDIIAETCKQLGSKAYVFPVDLVNPEQVAQVATEVISQFGKIDILVNNGGISQRSLVIDTPLEVDRKVMEIDFFSGVILTKKILPAMVDARFGHIIVISSITGIFGFPLRSAYAAAKHALHGFYDTLWAELHEKGIRVTLVCPGRVNTNVSINAITQTGQRHGVMDHDIGKGITPEACSHKILRAASKNKKIVYIAGKEMLMVYFKRYIPWLYYKLVSKVKPS